MISRTYGRMVSRHEGAAAVELVQQYRTAKVEAMSLLSARPGRSQLDAGGGSMARFFDPLRTRVGLQVGLRPSVCRTQKDRKRPICSANADVAQLVEHFTRNEGVPGSSPGVGSGKAL